MALQKEGGFIRKRLNTWPEICTQEDARLRTNTILFTFVVFCLYIVMAVADIIAGHTRYLPVSFFLMAVGLALFLIQFFSPHYKLWVAWVFGAMALGMCVYFLYFGGLGGYGYMWIFVVPHIAAMVLNTRQGVVYNALLLAVVAAMLISPLHTRLAYPHSPMMRYLFPIALFIVTLVVYLAERVRQNIQKQLALTTEKLQSFAFTDPLTGAYNRHALASHFGNLDATAEGLSFCIIDLDHFKGVNDRYGHLTGDKMLCHIVDILRQNIPAGALLYRWGGEEFCLVLKQADADGVQALLQALRRAVESTPLPTEEQAVPMTISMGAVCAAAGASINHCIARADEYLYGAKAAGRNRVVLGPV